METVFEIVRMLTFLTGTALLGRLGRDRYKLRKTHFLSQAAQLRWTMIFIFCLAITLGALIAFLVNAPISLASYVQFLNLAGISFAHFYLDTLRINEEAERIARIEVATSWLEKKLAK